jgi:L-alanine-DL-glutamate epimerase-like enolase superfamily enzyme
MPFDPLDSILRGQPAGDTGTLHEAMQLDLHWVGRGGVAAFALAAVYVALWDLRGRAAGLPLWRMAGGNASTIRAYRGAVDLDLSLQKLVESVHGHQAQGYRAMGPLHSRPSAIGH